MISRDGKEKCCIQVKTGNTTLDPENYIHLTENNVKVYLFTLEGYKRENINNVICLKKEEILDFIKNNKEILPSKIKYWMEEVEKNQKIYYEFKNILIIYINFGFIYSLFNGEQKSFQY